MGGSGGGGRLGNIKRLEEVANRALESKRRSVFISFANEDIDMVNLLRGQAKNENSEINFVDRSLQTPFDSTKADYIRNRLEDRIKKASITIVFISKDTPESKWVSWEVNKSIELGKDVVAIHAGTNAPSKLPPVVLKHGLKVVPWSKLADELD